MDKRYNPLKWKTLLALFLAFVALKFNWFFIWGVFCWFWGWENLRSKEAFFVERVERSKNPILFTVIIISWFLMGALYFYVDHRIYDFFYSL
ncbi:hypothetical protein QWZ04_04945 [Vibrio tapetis subsp. quintayensis]|uniref:hypothetical protein n=1 Tax=Vibrio tapetis TaxID=52443 RepID=UPI0025B42FE1|nr:hypothetical protein [Vibrio tapetis]MDN3679671.1 hypothetical protein [Vibrio tapetis subsp. quintayensis]